MNETLIPDIEFGSTISMNLGIRFLSQSMKLQREDGSPFNRSCQRRCGEGAHGISAGVVENVFARQISAEERSRKSGRARHLNY